MQTHKIILRKAAITKTIQKETITCGCCGSSVQFEDQYDKDNWTYKWVNIYLCDDCHVNVRMVIAEELNVEWADIDL